MAPFRAAHRGGFGRRLVEFFRSDLFQEVVGFLDKNEQLGTPFCVWMGFKGNRLLGGVPNCKRCALPASAERAASVVRLQAAELVKWRFRHGQVLASLDQLMSWARRNPLRQGWLA